LKNIIKRKPSIDIDVFNGIQDFIGVTVPAVKHLSLGYFT